MEILVSASLAIIRNLSTVSAAVLVIPNPYPFLKPIFSKDGPSSRNG